MGNKCIRSLTSIKCNTILTLSLRNADLNVTRHLIGWFQYKTKPDLLITKTYVTLNLINGFRLKEWLLWIDICKDVIVVQCAIKHKKCPLMFIYMATWYLKKQLSDQESPNIKSYFKVRLCTALVIVFLKLRGQFHAKVNLIMFYSSKHHPRSSRKSDMSRKLYCRTLQ